MLQERAGKEVEMGQSNANPPLDTEEDLPYWIQGPCVPEAFKTLVLFNSFRSYKEVLSFLVYSVWLDNPEGWHNQSLSTLHQTHLSI